MSTTPTPPSGATCLVPPDGGRNISAFGDDATILLSGKDTDGKYTMFISRTPPGGGPPVHCHMNEDEWFHVLEGHAQFFKDGQWLDGHAGASVYTPRGVVHTFRNAGTTPLKMLVHVAPSGFENFFSRCEVEFNNAKSEGRPPDMAALEKICGEHGIRIVK